MYHLFLNIREEEQNEKGTTGIKIKKQRDCTIVRKRRKGRKRRQVKKRETVWRGRKS